MEIGVKSQAIFEIPQVLMGSSLGSRWNTFASMQKKKIATASCKMLETVYLYIIFSSALLSKLQGFNVQEKARLPAVLWHSTNVYTARLRPEIQPLTLLYAIFHEKEPLSYTFYWQMVPLSHTSFRTLHPF